MTQNKSIPNLYVFMAQRCVFLVILLSLIGMGCSLPVSDANPPSQTLEGIPNSLTTSANLPVSEVTFFVEIPVNTPGGSEIQLTLLDEVTGLPYNQKHFTLQSIDAYHYVTVITVPVGSVIKYRYNRNGQFSISEYTQNGDPVRYRMYYVDGPGQVTDIVSRWSDTLPTPGSSRIIGQVHNAQNGVPVPNMLILAGGVRALSTSDGTFRLEGLPPGKHTLIAYAIDGRFSPFKQEIILANGTATEAAIVVQPANMVQVTFSVHVPADTVPTVPLRIAGDLFQLGNTFSDLAGGVNTLANRMPELQYQPDGSYLITLELPAGIVLHYKYTLGDGLWNAEHSTDGNFIIRELYIPYEQVTTIVEDYVPTWYSTIPNSIWFDLTTPSQTPETDDVYIQLKLLNWMEPIPLWRGTATRWGYRLDSPSNFANPIEYRFCRNAACGDTVGIATGDQVTPNLITPDLENNHTLFDTIDTWRWRISGDSPATVLTNAIHYRGDEFVAGVEFLPDYHPSWDDFVNPTMGEISLMNANWVVLSPTWSLTNQNPPQIEQIPGNDILWPDLSRTIQTAQDEGMKVALFPQPNFMFDTEEWWRTSQRDFAWWQAWFDSYRTFAIHHADQAQLTGVDTLILGGDWLVPALPGGQLEDGSSSNLPQDSQIRWENILSEIRTRFNGKISWVLSYPDDIINPPPFLELVDEFYILWDTSLSNSENPALSEMAAFAGEILDNELLPFQLFYNKPMVLAIAYPSVNGAASGCLRNNTGECIPWNLLSPPNPDIPELILDFSNQVEIYNALLASVNERAWIGGVVSRGYFPPTSLADKSISIRGKPAAEVLRFWFTGMLGGLQ
ncbi:MAG: hypothetical protein FVQ83_02310 [Chloroflexi bacterium]|nr:hypothetical protein [Chloroflexota bacterium]